jgi:tetratricopeptide (TPR) repeat protein
MDLEIEDEDQPAAADEHLRRAYVYEEQEEYEKALAESEAAIALGQSFLADAHNLRAIVLEALGRTAEAMTAYKFALRINPEFHDAAHNLLELEREMGISHDLVTIATFSQPLEAHVMRTKLEAEGIWSFVADEGIVTMNWLYTNVVGGVKLQVRKRDVERARDILGLDAEDTEFDDAEELRCPNCNASDVRYEKYATRGVFASWLLLQFPLPFLKRKWKCGECGYEWKERTGKGYLDDLVSLEEYVASHPDDAGRMYELADVYANHARWEEAIKTYRAALDLEPLNADLHNCLGVAYEEAGQVEGAEQSYQQAIQIKPQDAMFHYNLGTLYEAQQRTAEAVQAFRKCLRYSDNPSERSEVKARLRRLGD